MVIRKSCWRRGPPAAVPAHPEQALGMTKSLVCREWEPYGFDRGRLARRKRRVSQLAGFGAGQCSTTAVRARALPSLERPEGSGLAARSRSERDPNLGRVGRHRRQDRPSVGTIRRERSAEFDVRSHPKHRSLGDRAIALRRADISIVRSTIRGRRTPLVSLPFPE